MQELTDDQLDGLFRKSAEEFDTPYDPSGWEAMKDQLDDRDRAAFWKRLLPWGIPLLLLLLIGGTWYAYQKVRPTTNKAVAQLAAKKQPTTVTNLRSMPLADTPKQQDEARPATAARPTGAASASPVVKPDVTTEKQAVGLPEFGSERTKPAVRPDKPEAGLGRNATSNATKRPVVTYREKTENRSEPSIARTTLANSNRLTVTNRHSSRRLRKSGTKLTSRVNKPSLVGKRGSTTGTGSASAIRSTGSFAKRTTRNSVGRVPFIVSDAPDSGIPANTVTAESAESTPLVFPSIVELAIRQGKWAKLSTVASREITAPEQAEPVSVPAAQPSRGFSVRFAVSPDLSSIGLTNFSRPGTNVGLFLEYRIASRWSVQAGVIRSTKVYNASASQYDGEKYWPKWTVLPESVDGVCNMLDIPINVRYDIALRPRTDTRLQPSRWFVNAGVTSYIMLREDYTNNFADPSNPHIYSNMWSESAKTGGYGFSHLNISAGYERALSRRLSWQIEPFMKVPLKGVGLFKIDLLSTGAFLSLRYKL